MYASLIGLHHSTKVARALETDSALLVARGGTHSSATLRRFRQGNAELFAAAIDATVRVARARGLIDEKDLAIDSVRLRAHASTKAVGAVKRSTERLKELAEVDATKLPAAGRSKHLARSRSSSPADRPPPIFGSGDEREDEDRRAEIRRVP